MNRGPGIDERAAAARPLDALVGGRAVPWQLVAGRFEELAASATRDELDALVHDRLTRAGGACDWPESAREGFARNARAAAAAELLRARELTSVLQALADAGVAPVLVKGAALAYTVYDAPGCRPRTDADMVVPRSQVERVRRILARRGYVEARLCAGELVFCQFEMSRTDAFGVEHVLDVHWRISTQPVFADLVSYDELAAAAVPVPALGANARAAGSAHALLLAAVHPVMHHRNAQRPIWTYDVHLLASRMPREELEAFAALAVERQVAGICARQLALARSRFGTGTPDWLAAQLAAPGDAEPSIAYLAPGRRWHDELASGLHRLGWRDRLRLLREVAFPGPRYMLRTYGLGPAGAALLPALYAHRAAAGVWRIARGLK